MQQGRARELERACLEGVRKLDAGEGKVADVLENLLRYDELCDVKGERYQEMYREVLTDRPWKTCACEVCRALGHHVILFRGAERNRRRGFHNTWVFYRRLMREMGQLPEESRERPAARSKKGPCGGAYVIEELRLPAIEVRQSSERVLYTFAVDAKRVPSFATVSRIHRPEKGGLQGYQRPEVLAHIEEIRNYVECPSPMIPNAIVLSFDSRVRFEPGPGPANSYTRMGEIVSRSTRRRRRRSGRGSSSMASNVWPPSGMRPIDAFPICVSAFITDDVQQQTEQFILVNSTKPLPKGLIYELLPGTGALLPSLLQRRRLPALLLTRLNLDEASPLKGRIQTPTNPGGIIKDNSILQDDREQLERRGAVPAPGGRRRRRPTSKRCSARCSRSGEPSRRCSRRSGSCRRSGRDLCTGPESLASDS